MTDKEELIQYIIDHPERLEEIARAIQAVLHGTSRPGGQTQNQ